MTRLAVVIAVAALAATAHAGTNGGVPCAHTQLTGRVGVTHGAAGTIALSIVLTNVSRSPCTLGGYPALQMRNARGNLKTRVRYGGFAFLERNVRSFVVKPRGRATLLLAYSHVPRGGESCPKATALYVRPPGATAGIRVAVAMDPCNRGLISQSPLLPGVVAPA